MNKIVINYDASGPSSPDAQYTLDVPSCPHAGITVYFQSYDSIYAGVRMPGFDARGFPNTSALYMYDRRARTWLSVRQP